MHEIIFYNGFNLLVDIIIGGAVFFFASRYYWLKGYSDGYSDCNNHIECNKNYECDPCEVGNN